MRRLLIGEAFAVYLSDDLSLAWREERIDSRADLGLSIIGVKGIIRRVIKRVEREIADETLTGVEGGDTIEADIPDRADQERCGVADGGIRLPELEEDLLSGISRLILIMQEAQGKAESSRKASEIYSFKLRDGILNY